MANPFPFVSGAVLTAAELNSLGEAWTSYTPTIKGGATTVTATIQFAKYIQINKLWIVQVAATVTSAGAANGAVTISLPSTPVTLSVYQPRGVFLIDDAGVGLYEGTAVITNSYGSHTAVAGIGTGPTGDVMGIAAPTFTLANNDRVGMFVVYEVA